MSTDNEASIIWQEITALEPIGPGRKWTRFDGAMTREVLKKHLLGHGFPVSARDVFIRGLPLEIDLLITKANARPLLGIIYEPEDVLVALEVKRSGVFDATAAGRIGEKFRSICDHVGRRIPCAYVTIQERQTLKCKPIDNEDFLAFCLFWQTSSKDENSPQLSQDWGRLLDWLKGLVRPSEVALQMARSAFLSDFEVVVAQTVRAYAERASLEINIE